MTSKRQVRRRTCGNKTRHASEKEARAHLLNLVRDGRTRGGWLRPYKCSWCHCWHIGHA